MRMYGGTKIPSLLPKYAIDYIVHKEEIRKLFLDGFGSFIFNMKKVVFPPLHLYVGIYKLSKVKGTPNFVNNLEIFHFGEKSFRTNDAQGKVVAHPSLVKLNFEYFDHLKKYE